MPLGDADGEANDKFAIPNQNQDFDGNVLATGAGDHCVRLWDVRTGPRETAAALGGHVGGVTAVSPSPNGQAGSGRAFFTGEFLL